MLWLHGGSPKAACRKKHVCMLWCKSEVYINQESQSTKNYAKIETISKVENPASAGVSTLGSSVVGGAGVSSAAGAAGVGSAAAAGVDSAGAAAAGAACGLL